MVSYNNDRLVAIRPEYHGDPLEILSRKNIEDAINLYYDRLIAASDTTYDDEDDNCLLQNP